MSNIKTINNLYSKVIDNKLINHLMLVSNTGNKDIDVRKLCPTNIRLSQINDNWELIFNINQEEFSKILNLEDWSLLITSLELGLEATVDMNGIIEQTVEYENGVIVCKQITIGTVGEDDYRASAKWNINDIDYVPFYSLLITVIN